MRTRWNLLNCSWLITNICIFTGITHATSYGSERLELASIPDDIDEESFRLNPSRRKPVAKTLQSLTNSLWDIVDPEDSSNISQTNYKSQLTELKGIHQHVTEQLAQCKDLTQNNFLLRAAEYASQATNVVLGLTFIWGNYNVLDHWWNQTSPTIGENLDVPSVFTSNLLALQLGRIIINHETPFDLTYISIIDQITTLETLNTGLADLIAQNEQTEAE